MLHKPVSKKSGAAAPLTELSGTHNPAPAPLKIPVGVFKGYIGAGISTPIIVGDSMIAAGYDKKIHLYRIAYDASHAGAKGALKSPSGEYWTVGERDVILHRGWTVRVDPHRVGRPGLCRLPGRLPVLPGDALTSGSGTRLGERFRPSPRRFDAASTGLDVGD